MKVTDLCRKLRTALVAGGLLVPVAANAADLNTNLVVNGDFENVDTSSAAQSLYYGAPTILDWNLPPQGAFCYSHDYSYSGDNLDYAVPGFHNGTLAGGGHWYFTPGNSLIHSYADAIKQLVDVSTGDTAAAIAGGSATYDLSAFFSTYDGQPDRGFVRVEFLATASGDYNNDGAVDAGDYVVFQKLVGTVSSLPNDPNAGTTIDADQYNTWKTNFGATGGGSLGFAEVSTPAGPAIATWTEIATNGSVPIGTRSLRISAWGEPFVGSTGSADGYTDNIDFRILGALDGSGGAVPEASSILLVGIGLASLAIGGRRSPGNRSM